MSPRWPMRKTRPCSGPSPPAIATWKRSRATVRSASTSMPGATAMAVTDTERAAGRGRNSRIAPPLPQPSTAACTARASSAWRA